MSDRWQNCWDSGHEIHILLKESETLESAREKIINYLSALDWSYRKNLDEVPSWDYILLKEAVRCLKNIISPRNEVLAGVVSLEYLWKAAREGDSEASDAFIDEFTHMFKALKATSDVYPSHFMKTVEIPDFEQYKGREAAIRRSDFLDCMGAKMRSYVGKYPTGLGEEAQERRQENKQRILDYLGGNEDDWDDWHWHFRNVFTNGKGLEKIRDLIDLTPDEEKAIELATKNDVVFGVTPYYLSLMDHEPSDRDYAIRRQVFPPSGYVDSMISHKSDREFAFDFMREHDTSPVDLVTRRYPKVAIIKPYDSCPQICVYCQRNWEIESPMQEGAMAPPEKMDAALGWFADHDQILDVLVTGGDPLAMGDRRVNKIVGRLSDMPHIRSIRIATRTPVTVPQRITTDLCEIFSEYYKLGKQDICMVTHFQHPYEVTLDSAAAIKRVKRRGLHVYNQQVFSFATSRRFETVALRYAIKRIGVDPYYTFNMKGKREIESYAVPVARLLQERKEEARLLPGIFRTDEPVFNVPFLGKNHLRAWQDHELIAITPEGRRVYSFHPWEKNLSLVKPYLYTDVPIRTYLERLEERGEDPLDYQSIWYYY